MGVVVSVAAGPTVGASGDRELRPGSDPLSVVRAMRCLGEATLSSTRTTSSGLSTRGPPRLLRRGDQVVERPGLLEGDLREETESADRDVDRTGREPSLADQIHLIGANLLGTEVCRRPTKVPSKPINVLERDDRNRTAQNNASVRMFNGNSRGAAREACAANGASHP